MTDLLPTYKNYSLNCSSALAALNYPSGFGNKKLAICLGLRKHTVFSKIRKWRGVQRAVINDTGPDYSDTKATRGWEKPFIQLEEAFNTAATDAIIAILDGLYADRHYARFYVLETIAKSAILCLFILFNGILAAFVSVLHMYETFGWWRRADYLKVHFAESWNELHHLLVMEALGGDERWFDRFLAQHLAVGYYFLTVVMYMISPRMAYNFSECVEKHAYSTYDKFLTVHGEELRKLPPPEVAVNYYTEGDLYMFDEFQTGRCPESRRPKVENLYDVFFNIREDEAEHCKTMRACQVSGNLRSPHASTTIDCDKNGEAQTLPTAECAGIIDCAIKARRKIMEEEHFRQNGK